MDIVHQLWNAFPFLANKASKALSPVKLFKESGQKWSYSQGRWAEVSVGVPLALWNIISGDQPAAHARSSVHANWSAWREALMIYTNPTIWAWCVGMGMGMGSGLAMASV